MITNRWWWCSSNNNKRNRLVLQSLSFTWIWTTYKRTIIQRASKGSKRITIGPSHNNSSKTQTIMLVSSSRTTDQARMLASTSQQTRPIRRMAPRQPVDLPSSAAVYHPWRQEGVAGRLPAQAATPIAACRSKPQLWPAPIRICRVAKIKLLICLAPTISSSLRHSPWPTAA